MFTVKAGNFPRGLAIDGALLQIRALVTRNFALSNAELSFELPAFPVELENNKGAAGDLRLAVKLINLLSM